MQNTRGGKIGDFQRKLPFISETVQDKPMVTMEVMGAGSNGIIFDDLEWPQTRVSRLLYTYKSNISKTVHFRDKVTKEH